jgi:hypothetical protein
MNQPKTQSNQRALAPIIGQILITSLVVAAVLSVSAIAIPVIEENQASIQQEVMLDATEQFEEELMAVASTNISRATSIDAPAGAVTLGEETTTIQFEDTDSAQTHTIKSSNIGFTAGDSELTYEAGLLSRSLGPHSSQIESEPAQQVTTGSSSRYAIQFVELNVTETRRLTSGRAFNFQTYIVPRDAPQTSVFDSNNSGDIRVTVDTNSTAAWEFYFSNHPGFENVSTSSGEVVADVSPDTTLQVTSTPISVRAEQ